MKKHLLLFIVVIIGQQLTAQKSIGVNMRAAYSYFDNSSFDLKFGPVYSYTKAPNKERVMSIGYLRTSSSLKQDEQVYKSVHSGIWAEYGFNRQLVRSEIFRFSLGPNYHFTKKFAPQTKIVAGDSGIDISPDGYSSFSAGISMPVNTDIIVNEKLFLRVSAEVFNLELLYSNGTGNFHVDLKSVMTPYLMLFFQF